VRTTEKRNNPETKGRYKHNKEMEQSNEIEKRGSEDK